jgi:RNA polymerase sigma-70 factor (sigma-E family)
VSIRRDDGFDDLYRSEFPAIARTARMIVGDPESGRDIAQDAFVRLFAHWGRVSTYDQPGAWVRRVAINAAINAAARGRRRRRAADAYFRQLPQAHTDSSGCLDESLLQALGDLSPRQRAVIALYYLDDRSIPDVAGLIGATEATVKSHLHRARQRLAVLVNEETTDASA